MNYHDREHERRGHIHPNTLHLITTIKELCRVCYTCVRECPVKAIRITGGQAEIITERCISCGNCVRVCSQQAKHVKDSITEVTALFQAREKVIACLAPSFPAEFSDYELPLFLGSLYSLGFQAVTEVAFGADLIAQNYAQLLKDNPDKHYIATTCPAVVAYIEKYQPQIVSHLAPLVSPMVAMARVIKTIYGKETKIVFIGPCIAKKKEALKYKKDVDVVLTFAELRTMLKEQKQNEPMHLEHQPPSRTIKPGAFAPPYPGKGSLFPLSQGLVQAAGLSTDLIDDSIISADGTKDFVALIREFAEGYVNPRFLDVLCCNGCILGPGMTAPQPRYQRRALIARYAQERLKHLQANLSTNCQFKQQISATATKDLTNLNLAAVFNIDDQCLFAPSKEEIKIILQKLGKISPQDELNCGACGYDTCEEHAIAIHKGLAESEMCLPYTVEELKKTTTALSQKTEKLFETQRALVQSEKLASMGQLAAGIAHEVNNPLGVVLLYAHLLLEQCPPESSLHNDVIMIVEQADRCKKIVSGLLNFARKNKAALQRVDIYALLHNTFKNLVIPDNINFHFDSTAKSHWIHVDPDQFLQIMTNLIANAIEAMPEGGKLVITIEDKENEVTLKVRDTGIGIPEKHLESIFEPFFTTKQIGKGTGLGLAITYGIIKIHKGQILVESNADKTRGPTGTIFTIKLPRQEILEAF